MKLRLHGTIQSKQAADVSPTVGNSAAVISVMMKYGTNDLWGLSSSRIPEISLILSFCDFARNLLAGEDVKKGFYHRTYRHWLCFMASHIDMYLFFCLFFWHVFKVTEKEIHFLSANLRVKVIVQKILKSPAIQSSLQNKHELILYFLAITFLPFGKFVKYHWHRHIPSLFVCSVLSPATDAFIPLFIPYPKELRRRQLHAP